MLCRIQDAHGGISVQEAGCTGGTSKLEAGCTRCTYEEAHINRIQDIQKAHVYRLRRCAGVTGA